MPLFWAMPFGFSKPLCAVPFYARRELSGALRAFACRICVHRDVISPASP
jgi:hypothetical protein